MSQAPMTLALAGLTFLLTVIWGPPVLRLLRYFGAGKAIRIEGPQRHLSKMGTPTMGGWLFVLPVTLITILLNVTPIRGLTLLGRSVLLPLLVMIGFATLGTIDDWQGLISSARKSGLSVRAKFLGQVVLAIGAGVGLKYFLQVPEMFLPGIRGSINLGVFYLPIVVFIIVGMSNAVNFTDGLDGLAGLITATAFACYGGIALFQGQIYLARFCFALVGAIFGFLWFNVHPAELIMGDTGSMALGSSLAVVALMTGHWILLPIIAIIPVSETLSVIIQTSYFKYTKRKYGEGQRVFKMAPIHHHFELLGWSETQIVQRFWLVSLLAAMVGIALAIV
ncbi:MAG: phospho-N-acetylmuramoyl-pentapeptide-transferase [Anaerolineales bacterium]|nr:phospho-N-acetylmuramoyl-pentapeptide-transferase [Anaerolineales bacterium]MCS7246673.1 phospho-N-acetylmuramoyl-pentapeptide-transferase [Anaerolineales bacterium]MDW8160483.1 phospho-N-acetylmuramoyl-pentapeptide-transferase [Anaerolineales bacterium]MDW8446202.1 phospho-N-acetylmuramoyl-pentapeptide-transferase [Anaerolineales bacterium]